MLYKPKTQPYIKGAHNLQIVLDSNFWGFPEATSSSFLFHFGRLDSNRAKPCLNLASPASQTNNKRTNFTPTDWYSLSLFAFGLSISFSRISDFGFLGLVNNYSNHKRISEKEIQKFVRILFWVNKIVIQGQVLVECCASDKVRVFIFYFYLFRYSIR